MIPVCAGSNTLMPAYPALGEIIEQAERVRVGEHGESVTQLAVDLAVAWESCRKVTGRHFPGAWAVQPGGGQGPWRRMTKFSMSSTS